MSQEEEKKVQQDPITVVITGASGFVASHIIKQLLSKHNEKRYHVIGTIRGDPKDSKTIEKYQWLLNLNETNDAQALTLFNADLLTLGAYDECCLNADYVMHVASPYVISPHDVVKELVEPAVKGTQSILESCKKAYLKNKKLKKIIITSSMASITDSPSKKYTENDWNLLSSIDRNAYYYSKVAAEMYAWKWLYQNGDIKNWEQLKVIEDYIKKDASIVVNPNDKVGFDMIVINPWMVIGRELHNNPNAVNTSNGVFASVINGEYPAKMNLAWAFVDVRDVAKAHILTMEKQDTFGRYIVAAQTLTFEEICQCLNEISTTENIEESIPCCPCDCNCCYCFLWCASFAQPKGVGDFIRTNINKTPQFNNSRISQLGLEFHDVRMAVKDAVVWEKEVGVVSRR